jgi:transposase InsO family protein
MLSASAGSEVRRPCQFRSGAGVVGDPVDDLLDKRDWSRRSRSAAMSEVERLMTDNGPAYVSVAHALACRALGIKHIRTRPYRPQTNGKAERFIRTMLREWAYAAVYGSSRRLLGCGS